MVILIFNPNVSKKCNLICYDLIKETSRLELSAWINDDELKNWRITNYSGQNWYVCAGWLWKLSRVCGLRVFAFSSVSIFYFWFLRTVLVSEAQHTYFQVINLQYRWFQFLKAFSVFFCEWKCVNREQAILIWIILRKYRGRVDFPLDVLSIF